MVFSFPRPGLRAALAALCCAAAGPALAQPACDGLRLTTPGDYTCVVPGGVDALYYEVVGGSGGRSGNAPSWPYPLGSPGGRGARITGILPVAPGWTLYLTVGGNGGDGQAAHYGGGGGGYSAVAMGSHTQGPAIVAGGGGGGSIPGEDASFRYRPARGGDADAPGEGRKGWGGGQPGWAGGAGGGAGNPGAGGMGGPEGAHGADGGNVALGSGGGGGGGGFGAHGGFGGWDLSASWPPTTPLSHGGGGQGGDGRSGGPFSNGGGGGGGGGLAGGGGGLGGEGANTSSAGGGGGSSQVPTQGPGTWGLGDGQPRVVLRAVPSCDGLRLDLPGESAACKVPDGVHALAYDVVGANGGRGGGQTIASDVGGAGGRGARVTGMLPVAPGQTLYLNVGSHGADGSLAYPVGGGGGGYSAVAATSHGQDPLIVAAGGGGGGVDDWGNESGGDADAAASSAYPALAGKPGVGTAGGAGGSVGDFGGPGGDAGQRGAPGAWGTQGGAGGGGGGFGALGGAGGFNGVNGPAILGGAGGSGGGGEGGGRDSGGVRASGGGGGGLAGGGGGGMSNPLAGGGGGGSSLVPANGLRTLGDGTPRIVLAAVAVPAVATLAVDGIGATTATLRGSVDAAGADAGAVFFRYGTVQADVDGGLGTQQAATPAAVAVADGTTAVAAAVTGLAPGTTYYVRAYATNAGGTGAGATQTFTTPVIAPGAPQGVSATPGDGSARIAWSAPASDGGSTITAYEVTANGAATACTASPCIVTGLANGVPVNFEVRARNAVGLGAAASASATPALLGNAVVPLPGGGGSATVTIGGNPPGCVLNGAITINTTLPPGAPANATAPLGVLRFAASGCAGATLVVRAAYPAGRLAGLAPYKFGPPLAGEAARWFGHGTVSGDTVEFTVQDDGMGDNDTATPGAIADPFALLALPVNAAAIPTLSQWGVLLLSGLLGVLALRRRA